MEPRRIQKKILSEANWREEVLAFQRAGVVDKQFLQVARSFGGGGRTQVRLANPDILAERRLIEHVLDGCDFLKIRSIPPVAIVTSPIVNAASVGGKGIFFTSGIMQAMPDAQLRGVVGHELSHHRHAWRDQNALLAIEMGIAAAVEITKFSCARVLHAAVKPVRRSSMAAVNFVGYCMDLAVVGAIFTPWRWFMELDSDKDGAAFASPKQMGDALGTLKEKSVRLEKKPEGFLAKTLHLALKFFGRISTPFGSHPPIDYRIQRMREAELSAPTAGQGPAAPTPNAMHDRPQATVHAQQSHYDERVRTALPELGVGTAA